MLARRIAGPLQGAPLAKNCAVVSLLEGGMSCLKREVMSETSLEQREAALVTLVGL